MLIQQSVVCFDISVEWENAVANGVLSQVQPGNSTGALQVMAADLT